MKIEGCKETLATFPRTPSRQTTTRKLGQALDELDRPPETVEDIRMIEARAFFTHWQELHLHWKGVGRKPIPAEWYRMGLRKGLFGTGNRHATHPVNAVLNYAYSAPDSQVRIGATAAGLDPTIGYLHARHPGRLALVYDHMEPLRPKVDSKVLDFLRSHTFSPSDFLLTSGGVVRLHPQLARIVAGLSVANSETLTMIDVVSRHMSTGRAAVATVDPAASTV